MLLIKLFIDDRKSCQFCKYRKQEKIYWAKLSRIPPNEVFTGKLCGALSLKHSNNAIIRSLYDINKYIHEKTFAVLLKTVKKAKV